MADDNRQATEPQGNLLTEPVTWRVLVKRFRTAENRPRAARNLIRHAVRAIIGRARRVIHPLRVAAYEVKVQALIAAAYPLGYFRSPHQIVTRFDAPARPIGPDIALFVHFDAAGRVAPTTRAFIGHLADAGLSVVFVSNSGRIGEEDAAFLHAHCATILVRRNIGYDFGAWRDALDTLGLPRAETRAIYLVNDSVFGPFADLAPLLGQIDFTRADLWGITESWQHRYHLQSYFLACGGTAIRSGAWRRFWRSVRPVPCKHWVIRHCEIGFTRALARGGITHAAIYPNRRLLDVPELERLARIIAADAQGGGQNKRLRAEARHADRLLRGARGVSVPLNPSIDLWRQLLQAGYPFVKRELLLRNPSRVSDIFAWEEVVSESLQADPKPLADEIRRSLGARLPEIWNAPAPEPERSSEPAA